MKNQDLTPIRITSYWKRNFAGVTSVEELLNKLPALLDERLSGSYIEAGIPCNCGSPFCSSDLRSHIEGIREVPGYAQHIVDFMVHYDAAMAAGAVDVETFFDEFVADVTTPEGFLAKLAKALDEPGSDIYIQPGILAYCEDSTCTKDLREHMEDARSLMLMEAEESPFMGGDMGMMMTGPNGSTMVVLDLGALMAGDGPETLEALLGGDPRRGDPRRRGRRTDD